MFAQSLDLGPRSEFIRDVRKGLGDTRQKQLPCTYLYDEIGAALFEAITLLPEYGLTRADARLLENHASELARCLPDAIVVAELGSGSGRKTRWVLEALAKRRPLDYFPIDISHSALVKCRGELGRLERVRMTELELSYLDGLREVMGRRKRGQRLLLLFLGSTIGNFEHAEAHEFLKAIRAHLAPGDALLLGTDLVKPVPQLLAAYNDPTGVTAAFNLNLLARINHDLGGEFVLTNFEHEAVYNPAERRIEMYLRSTSRQRARIREAGMTITLKSGETIWTESSHKYQLQDVRELSERTGFRLEAQWVDEEWPFAETLLLAGS
ncbi:MAG: L-histidine N(alpha)-methyltransferase [Acidobacteria bacterium]|nr:MAG: L-histidine N(alpha)-methyltransferase [Acidobacteriota bacterium]